MMARNPCSPLLLGLVATGLTACEESGPTGYQVPITISMSARSIDTTAGMISLDKSISAATGNQYSAFVVNAKLILRTEIGRIDVEAATLALDTGSIGVTSLGDVFGGTTEVLLQMNDTGTIYPVASADVAPITTEEVKLTTDFVDELPAEDLARMKNGSFKVMLRGTAATGFEGKGAEANLKTTLTFVAYQ